MQLLGVKENTEAHVTNIQYNSHYPQHFLAYFFFCLIYLTSSWNSHSNTYFKSLFKILIIYLYTRDGYEALA